jgi:hypothetical protein
VLVNRKRNRAVAAYVHAFRTGDDLAVRHLAPHLTANIVTGTEGRKIRGREAVLDHLTRQCRGMPGLTRGGWSEPEESSGRLRMVAVFPPLGGGPEEALLTFSFDEDDKISHVHEILVFAPSSTTGAA